MPNDNEPITRAVLREELKAFAENLKPAFEAIERTIEVRVEASETRMLTEMERVEVRLTQRIETVGVSYRKLEADVASLTRRVEDLERFLHPNKPSA